MVQMNTVTATMPVHDRVHTAVSTKPVDNVLPSRVGRRGAAKGIVLCFIVKDPVRDIFGAAAAAD